MDSDFPQKLEAFIRENLTGDVYVDEHLSVVQDDMTYDVRLEVACVGDSGKTHDIPFHSVRKMLDYMKNSGGIWQSADEIRMMHIGFVRTDQEPIADFVHISMKAIRETKNELTPDEQTLMSDRDKLAEMCSV